MLFKLFSRRLIRLCTLNISEHCSESPCIYVYALIYLKKHKINCCNSKKSALSCFSVKSHIDFALYTQRTVYINLIYTEGTLLSDHWLPIIVQFVLIIRHSGGSCGLLCDHRIYTYIYVPNTQFQIYIYLQCILYREFIIIELIAWKLNVVDGRLKLWLDSHDFYFFPYQYNIAHVQPKSLRLLHRVN